MDISYYLKSIRFHGVFLLPPALFLFVFVVALIVVVLLAVVVVLA